MIHRTLTAALVLPLLGSVALAQGATRVRGTVVSIDGTALALKDLIGHDLKVTLSPTCAVTALVPAKLGDVTPGSFIGAAADTLADGTPMAKATAPSTSDRGAP